MKVVLFIFFVLISENPTHTIDVQRFMSIERCEVALAMLEEEFSALKAKRMNVHYKLECKDVSL